MSKLTSTETALVDALEIVTLQAQLATAQKRVAELEAKCASIEHAAHMPADYPHGLPTWINMELYASYIGAKVSPHITELIETGRLTFPNAPRAALAGDAGKDDEMTNKTKMEREWVVAAQNRVWQLEKALVEINGRAARALAEPAGNEAKTLIDICTLCDAALSGKTSNAS
jgi:hypothetical protein